MSGHYQKAEFLLSVANVKQLPADTGIEVAIVGRSNAGKSSILNCITQNKNLARVSKTPGRTQMINLFSLDDKRRMADLPGYGFAKVPLAAKRQWEKTVDNYISERKCLKGLLLVMDIRHPFRDLDMQLLEFCDARALPVHILLNKADKLSNNEIAKTLQQAKLLLAPFQHAVSYQLFSALKKSGIKELQTFLNDWYQWK